MMLLVHKVIVKSPKEDAATCLVELLLNYSSMFRELASLIFDLGPYLHYIKGTANAKVFVQAFMQYGDDPSTAPERRCRILLNLRKIEQVLAVRQDTEDRLKQLQENYLEFVKLDGKPEKGERKPADDFLLLINEVSNSNEVHEMLYLASLNEYALQLSPYNFDINMNQIKLYDKLGMSISYQTAHNELNLKGV